MVPIKRKNATIITLNLRYRQVLPNKKYAIIISKGKGNQVDYFQLISFFHDIFLIDNTSPFDSTLL
ncbi:MAG TPA: hypothetical protein VIA08_01965 [Nitrososphaeraceae archaeon]|jgi:hypothetical protein